jgi:hypothetical protein
LDILARELINPPIGGGRDVHHCDTNTVAMIMTLSARDPAQKFALAAVAVAAFLACWSGEAFGQSFEEWDRHLRREPVPSVASERRFDGAAPPKTVLYEERGGRLVDHWERWKALAAQGGEVEIRGPCYSACTLIMAHIPKGKALFRQAC